ncbi:MAG: exopolysaccharide Pel transporter PelG [Butyrivibrio sp.]|uniref:exopolysaccharide Pel transporter PelG n=1 Tax=Butyrivibrio sp. TaxID=28121 RepID=UPI0025E35DDB|nr:exopolysaccharide Pel transporter PelG [Butyrivibrio sp.]MCR5771629.1 exopolysaccharide Pel transporter PelG [Butyrivibrio sp.]
MAGIGFELKKLFRATGVLGVLRAYGYTGMITAGPMLLGIFYLMGVGIIGSYFGLDEHNRELLTSMITYNLLISLMVTSIFSMVVTRYISDMLYQENEDEVLSSLSGVLFFILPIGCLFYGVFQMLFDTDIIRLVLNLTMLAELLCVWMMMNYLTAIKNYKGILIGYVISIIVSLGGAVVACHFVAVSIELLLLFVCLGYGVMMCVDLALLYQYFPAKTQNYFSFLHWIDEYRSLVIIGFFSSIGLYSHLVIAWFSGVGKHIEGQYYGAPQHDIAALFAFLTILVTNINFVASVEVHFYPKYRKYYDLFNGKGSISEIEVAEKEMKEVLLHELVYTARRQFYTTALMLSIGMTLLNKLPLGFDDLMDGYFRILCVGYGVYAIGNVIMLILMYFTDYEGAGISTIIFAVISTVGSVISIGFNVRFYGFAFALGSMAYLVYCILRLYFFLQNIPYHILASQPMVRREKRRFFTFLGEDLNKNLKQSRVFKKRKIVAEDNKSGGQ